MFTFKVKRRCGHEETVTITETLPPGKQFKTAIVKLEKEESAKLCTECLESTAETKPSSELVDWMIVAAVVLGILFFVTIIGIPFGLQTLKMGSLAAWPFGRTSRPGEKANGCVSIFMNVLWLLAGGVWIALTHALLGVLLTFTIIGIPFAKQHFKLTELAINPFGRRIMHI